MSSAVDQCDASAQVVDRNVLDDRWTVEADVVGGELHPDNQQPYVFSDGIGRISVAEANKAAKKLELDHVPSAFQVPSPFTS